MATGLLGVLTHRIRATDARRLAKVLLPIPDQVTPHRCIDTELAKYAAHVLRDLCRKVAAVFGCRPAK